MRKKELTHREFARKGGLSRSTKKVEAVRANIQKAREARWPKKEQTQNEQPDSSINL